MLRVTQHAEFNRSPKLQKLWCFFTRAEKPPVVKGGGHVEVERVVVVVVAVVVVADVAVVVVAVIVLCRARNRRRRAADRLRSVGRGRRCAARRRDRLERARRANAGVCSPRCDLASRRDLVAWLAAWNGGTRRGGTLIGCESYS